MIWWDEHRRHNEHQISTIEVNLLADLGGAIASFVSSPDLFPCRRGRDIRG